MKLAARLLLVFGSLSAVSMGGLGVVVRMQLIRQQTSRFGVEVSRTCELVRREVEREAERDARLIENTCSAGELVDRVAVELSRGTLAANRTRFALLVPESQRAFGLDGLVLATAGGDVVGASPRALGQVPPAEVDAWLHAAPLPRGFELRHEADQDRTLVRCSKGSGVHRVGLLGLRDVSATARRLEKELVASIRLGQAALRASPPNVTSARCALEDGAGHELPIAVDRSREELDRAIADLDRVVVVSTLAAVSMALLLAIVLARTLGKPLAQLAVEARRVKTGDAKPLRVVGSGEVRELVQAFDTMLTDLAEARSRLAAASRVAAWREVAKRVAHEIKNPLAPIRAAVETLRRLWSRKDPAFDEYFDEASRTVLDEVHRISHIVGEFTRFARLPPPAPRAMDLAEVVRSVVALHEHAHPKVRVVGPPADVSVPCEADRDQVVQVLTNLVQNACDSVMSVGGGRVVVEVGEGGSNVRATVKDDGAGLDEEMLARLFEPYATSKEHGTGLGLAISQRIAHEHGGDLRYVGPLGARGAVFELMLPQRSGGVLP